MQKKKKCSHFFQKKHVKILAMKFPLNKKKNKLFFISNLFFLIDFLFFDTTFCQEDFLRANIIFKSASNRRIT